MGRAPCCEKVGLKKGRWTSQEDEILINYIQANGEGSWRSLPKNAGLKRCGKSCRLRWINYLRADLKRGNISAEEEDIIIKLHASLGNRWSLIASQLAGRTDNEIKNYWNSHLSRKIDTFRRPITTVNTTSRDILNSFSSSSSTLPAAVGAAAAMINNNNDIMELDTHKIPSRRRGGRTSRSWAMMKNKTYTSKYAQRHNKGHKAHNHHKDINNDIAVGSGCGGGVAGADDRDHLNVVGEAIATMQDVYMVLMEPTVGHDHHDAKDGQKDCRAPSLYDEQQETGSGVPMVSSSSDEKEIHDESPSLRPCEERRSVNNIDDQKEISDGDILGGPHNSHSQSQSHDDDDDMYESDGIDGGLLASFNYLMDNVGLPDPNEVLTLSNDNVTAGFSEEIDQLGQLDGSGINMSSSNGQLVPIGGACRYSCSSMSMASSFSSAGNFDIDDAGTGNNINFDHHMLWDWESSVVQAGHDYLWDDHSQNKLSWLWEGTASTGTTTHDRHNWEEGGGEATSNSTNTPNKFVREAVDPAEKQNAMVAWLPS